MGNYLFHCQITLILFQKELFLRKANLALRKICRVISFIRLASFVLNHILLLNHTLNFNDIVTQIHIYLLLPLLQGTLFHIDDLARENCQNSLF